MNDLSDMSFSASNLNEIIKQLEHNTILGNIKNSKERFWDVVIVDILINNNDRNEDNWGVIKYKDRNEYKFAPVFDCGNSFYSKADETKIASLLADYAKLMSSSLNIVTAYEDDKEKRISTIDLLNIRNEDLYDAILRIYKKVESHLDEIKELIYSVPNKYNEVDIISEERKEYYFNTFKLRLEHLLKPKCEEIKNLK